VADLADASIFTEEDFFFAVGKGGPRLRLTNIQRTPCCTRMPARPAQTGRCVLGAKKTKINKKLKLKLKKKKIPPLSCFFPFFFLLFPSILSGFFFFFLVLVIVCVFILHFFFLSILSFNSNNATINLYKGLKNYNHKGSDKSPRIGGYQTKC
jgi:hypothetical protein